MKKQYLFEYTQTSSDLNVLSLVIRGLFFEIMHSDLDKETIEEIGFYLSKEVSRLAEETDELLSLAMLKGDTKNESKN